MVDQLQQTWVGGSVGEEHPPYPPSKGEKKPNFVLVSGLMALLVSSAQAASIAVYPSEARLEHQLDTQRLTVVLTRDDGVTVDVTAQASLAFAADGIAAWNAGTLAPVADGDTTATVTFESHTASVPVKVVNSTTIPPASFRNDVLPVLMRMGCNSGACHGSARGKNGFHLSLFGYNPSEDYTSLTRDVRARRLNPALPDQSLMLLKPIGAVDHEGGALFEKETIFYNTLRQWIAEGSKSDPADVKTLAGIEILPETIVLQGEGSTQQVVVQAIYSDGTNEDVTELAILASSDDMTVAVDPKGLTTAKGRGEAYVMARYGSFALVSQVIAIPAGLELQWPETPEKNFVDTAVYAKLKKLRVPPAEACADDVFLRRVYLDILGVLPKVEEARAYLEDANPDKRAALIDTLLQRPEFAEVWAMKWADVLRVRSSQVLKPKGMHRYNDWLRQAIASNMPLDQMVRELLTAEGGTFTAPAANFYLVETEPTVIAENVAQIFMGVQIKCAQCHNHPFERWTMDDYYSFAAFFSQVGRKASSDPRETIIFNSGGGEVANLRDGRQMPPKFLGGDTPDVAGHDRRAVLAGWLTSPDNPWFAKNIANRVWEHFMGRGIVDPADDVRVTNPPSHPELLEQLAAKLVEYKYDLRGIIRDICNSHTYQMSTQPRDPAITDERNFAYARIRRMPAEQLLDAICTVTDTDVKFPGLPIGARAAQVADGASGNYFLDTFGRPPRDTVCTCERRGEPTLAQALHLINGSTVEAAMKSTDSRIEAQIAQQATPETMVDEIYLAAYARLPREDEKQMLVAHLNATEDKRAALEDIYWSILNSKEFIFNH